MSESPSFYFLLFIFNCFILVELNKIRNAPFFSCFFFLRYLASGSGDTTVRFWDLTTETPLYTARGIN